MLNKILNAVCFVLALLVGAGDDHERDIRAKLKDAQRRFDDAAPGSEERAVAGEDISWCRQELGEFVR